jgi:hypothetical protein
MICAQLEFNLDSERMVGICSHCSKLSENCTDGLWYVGQFFKLQQDAVADICCVTCIHAKHGSSVPWWTWTACKQILETWLNILMIPNNTLGSFSATSRLPDRSALWLSAVYPLIQAGLMWCHLISILAPCCMISIPNPFQFHVEPFTRLIPSFCW